MQQAQEAMQAQAAGEEAVQAQAEAEAQASKRWLQMVELVAVSKRHLQAEDKEYDLISKRWHVIRCRGGKARRDSFSLQGSI